MPPTGKTPRRGLLYFETTDAPKYHEWGQLLAGALDNDVEGAQGTLAERPAAKLRGRVYYVTGDATEANNGILWWDTGTTWVTVAPQDGPVAVSTLRSLGSGAKQAVQGSIGVVNKEAGRQLELRTFERLETIGTGGTSGPVSVIAGAFPTMTYAVWHSTTWYSDAAHTVITGTEGGWLAYSPSGNSIALAYAGAGGKYLYPISRITAIGY